MKKILLTLAALACSMQLSFASTAPSDTTKTKRPKLSVQEHREILMQTRHEVRVGSSLYGLSVFSHLSSALGSEKTTNNKAIPSLSAEYSYRAVEFLEVGGFFALNHNSYTSNTIDTDPNNNGTISNCAVNQYAIVAFARYSWLNRRYVQLYSSVGVGVNIENKTSTDTKTGKVSNSNYVTAIPEFVPIGVRFGGRLFGYFEPAAFSARGIIFNLGMGFKF